MAFNSAPNLVLDEMTLGTTPDTIIIPLTQFDDTQPLTTAETNLTTGDWREIIFSILDHFTKYYTALETADRPDLLTMRKTGTLASSGQMSYTYTVTILTDVTVEDIPPDTNV